MNKERFKDALWLTRFEIRHSWLGYLLLIILFILLYVFSFPSFSVEEIDGSMGLDFNFLFILFVLPAIVKVKTFRNISVGHFIYVMPFHLLARQLPIERSAYIMYHFLYRFLLSAVVTTIYLLILYPLWETTIPFSHYLSFIALWIALTFTIHLFDAYSQFGFHFLIWVSLIILLLPILLIVNLLIFYLYLYEFGFVPWTLEMAKNFPVYTSLAAIVIIVLNLIVWNKLFRRKFDNMDLYD